MSNSSVKSVLPSIPENDSAQTAVDSLVREAEKDERHQSLDSWYYLILSYLSSSKFIFQEIKSKGLDDNRKLIIPALYNLKHTVEIILKYLCLSNKIDYDWSHDIEILIKQLWETKKMRKEGKKLTKSKNPNEYQAFEDIINLSRKYATLEFLTPKFGAFLISDGKNDLFRYPNGQTFIKRIDYNMFASNIELADITNILEDVLLLEKDIEILKDYFVSENLEDY